MGRVQGRRHVAVDGTQQGTSHEDVVMCRAKVLGPDARGRQAWSRGDARCIGRHGLKAMPKMAIVGTSECAAEQSRLMAERGQRLAVVAKPKAAGQSRGLYDVIIQVCMALDRARGNASDSWHTKPECVGDSAEPRLWNKAGGGWYMAKNGSGSGRRYVL